MNLTTFSVADCDRWHYKCESLQGYEFDEVKLFPAAELFFGVLVVLEFLFIFSLENVDNLARVSITVTGFHVLQQFSKSQSCSNKRKPLLLSLTAEIKAEDFLRCDGNVFERFRSETWREREWVTQTSKFHVFSLALPPYNQTSGFISARKVLKNRSLQIYLFLDRALCYWLYAIANFS